MFEDVKDKPIVCVCVFGCVFPQLDEGTPPEPEGSFVDYQTSMVKHSKAIAVTAQEMVSPFKIVVIRRYYCLWKGKTVYLTVCLVLLGNCVFRFLRCGYVLKKIGILRRPKNKIKMEEII